MQSMVVVLAMAGLACGGQPALKNAPRPDPVVVAGVAAAAATAVTLADPAGAARSGEHKGGEPPAHTLDHQPSIPADVLDRADPLGVDAGVDARPPPPDAAAWPAH